MERPTPIFKENVKYKRSRKEDLVLTPVSGLVEKRIFRISLKYGVFHAFLLKHVI
jgi:hypothetical protein